MQLRFVARKFSPNVNKWSVWSEVNCGGSHHLLDYLNNKPLGTTITVTEPDGWIFEYKLEA